MEAREEVPKVTVLEDASEVARAAAERFVELAQSAVEERGRFAVALAGGSTPKRTYELLAGDDYRDRLDWSKAHVFFGDERMVPPDDAESNYRMASEAMLSRLPVPPENVHRINGLGDAVANARLYEDELRTFFNDAAWPSFDLVLLGMGDDGHTASLFPGTRALDEREAWAAANWVEKLNAYRVTLTAPAINRAARVIFLVTGANKAGPLVEVLKGEFNPRRLPSQLIKPLDGSLEWLVDVAAAARLVAASGRK
ncbi:MAG TPA: 6-phosphogluconolactonase [Pyrinomonadaceae bacterium]|nr:6-phosphogluconolactonase [Pyrinomonadaceae bacterium]